MSNTPMQKVVDISKSKDREQQSWEAELAELAELLTPAWAENSQGASLPMHAIFDLEIRMPVDQFIANRIEDIFGDRWLWITLNTPTTKDKSVGLKVNVDGKPLAFYIGLYDAISIEKVLSNEITLNGRLYGTIEFLQMMKALRLFNADAMIPPYNRVLHGDISEEFLINVYGHRTVNAGSLSKDCYPGYADTLQYYPTVQDDALNAILTK